MSSMIACAVMSHSSIHKDSRMPFLGPFAARQSTAGLQLMRKIKDYVFMQYKCLYDTL